jgi:large subunit ribosomal protein L17
MQHRRTGRKFSREKNQRKALLKTLLGSFFMNEKIKTTEAKAKEIKPMIDRLITRVKKAVEPQEKISVARELRKYLPVPAIAKLTGDLMKKFDGRSSGYSRIIPIGKRKSDGAEIAVIEIV